MLERRVDGASLQLYFNPSISRVKREIGSSYEPLNQYIKDPARPEKHHIVITDEPPHRIFFQHCLSLVGLYRAISVSASEKPLVDDLLKNGSLEGRRIDLEGYSFLFLTGMSLQLYKDLRSSPDTAPLFSQLSLTLQERVVDESLSWQFEGSWVRLPQPEYKRQLLELLHTQFIDQTPERLTEIMTQLKHGAIMHELAHFQQNQLYFQTRGYGKSEHQEFKRLQKKLKASSHPQAAQWANKLGLARWRLRVFDEAQAMLAELRLPSSAGSRINEATVYRRYSHLASAIGSPEKTSWDRFAGYCRVIAQQPDNWRELIGSEYTLAPAMLVLGDFNLLETVKHRELDEVMEKIDTKLALMVSDLPAFVASLDTPWAHRALDLALGTLSAEYIGLLRRLGSR